MKITVLKLRLFFTKKQVCYLLFVCLFLWVKNTADAQLNKDSIITFKSLLQELTNREQLTFFTGNNYTLHQASSYDRRSNEKDKEGWYANNDWDGYIRKENTKGYDEYVLMDADGPGVITRFWAAGHPNQKAHLRFYIDGNTTPFWEADHTGALIGKNTAIGAPLSERSVDADTLNINEGAQPGHNLYAPIPFNHHIKITYDRAPGGADYGFWYNINYRIYKPGTVVESFSAEAVKKYAVSLTQTNTTLKDFMNESPLETLNNKGTKHKEMQFDLLPSTSKNLEVTGGGAVKKLQLSLKNFTANALKNLWLQITFDGKETVNVPAGFLFGNGTQNVQAKDWYTKADTSGDMAVYWVMPYKEKAVVKLLNEGGEKINGTLQLSIENYTWRNNSMYFNAAYKELLNFAVTAQKGEDFNYLTLSNKAGLYVGDMLQITKTVGGWWGEGDEKIYVDGSKFPDNFGTGTEDYYGYAWGHPETFNHPFISQPIGNANLMNTGGTTVNTRKRSLDAIPFTTGFVFDMEAWNWATTHEDIKLSCFYYTLP